MIFLKKAVWSIGVVALCCLCSCGDSDLLKFDNVGVKNWEPDYTLQLAFADYTVWKLIEQTDSEDSTIVNENNTLLIRYTEKDIYHLQVDEVVELPHTIASFYKSISLPNVPEALSGTSVTVWDSPIELVHTINFRKGELMKLWGSVDVQYKLFPNVAYDTLEVTFTNVLDSISLRPVCVKFTPQDVFPKQEKLEHIVFDMSEHPNQIKCEIRVKGLEAQVGDASELIIMIGLENMVFSRIEGKMEPIEQRIPAGTFNMGIEFWNNFSGSFYFEEPRVDIIVRNYGLAVPMQADMNFIAYGENKSKALEPRDRLTFEGWQLDSTVTKEIQGYNVSNSNIAELFSLPPKDSISYSGEITVFSNPEKQSVILSDGVIDVDARVEIPFNLKAKELMFKDTIDDINISDAEKIKTARISVWAKNNIPLGLGEGYLYFLDENKNCIDSVVVERFLDAPELNAEDSVESKMPPIVLTDTNILNLNNTKYIVISVKAETSGGGEKPVIIEPDAELNLRLILEAKLNMDSIF